MITESVLVGVDTGGTFTDLVACEADGTVQRATKVLTTPHDPSEGILNVFRESECRDVVAFLHGTTTATNALLERRGARTALLTTAGFRDVLELGRQARPSLYDWFERKPASLVERHLSLEIDERISADATPRRELNEPKARQAMRILREENVESVAVCLLHSYRNPAHEQRLRELLDEELPGVHVSLSSDILPEIMEYERTSTTVANAYLAPVVEGYVGRLVDRLRAIDLTTPIYVMKSSGGLASAGTIASQAVQTVLSGPAAGVLGGLASTGTSAHQAFLTIDMGGTSFDVGYVENGHPTISRETTLNGVPIAVPALDIHTLGAGGGSLAWIDKGGALRVGPESAGSRPGPVCYGLGGDEPTVTDANLVLGRLPEKLLGGRLELDRDAAWAAVDRRIAGPLRLSVPDAARGIIDVVNAAMAKAMHLMSVVRGRDPRSFGVVGFGGAGPLHACELAASIEANEVIIPLLPGNTSALGLALADVRRERSATILTPIADLDDAQVADLLANLGRMVIADLERDDVDPRVVRLLAFARVAYEGQRYQLEIPLAAGQARSAAHPVRGSLADLEPAFIDRHLATYGYTRQEPLILFSLDVVGLAPISDARTPKAPRTVAPVGEDAPPTTRDVWFQEGQLKADIYSRSMLRPERPVQGPAVVEQEDTTIVIPPTWAGASDRLGNLVLRRLG